MDADAATCSLVLLFSWTRMGHVFRLSFFTRKEQKRRNIALALRETFPMRVWCLNRATFTPVKCTKWNRTSKSATCSEFRGTWVDVLSSDSIPAAARTRNANGFPIQRFRRDVSNRFELFRTFVDHVDDVSTLFLPSSHARDYLKTIYNVLMNTVSSYRVLPSEAILLSS